MNPFEVFNNWYNEELKHSNLKVLFACCLSTIGLDGYPNARFISLKEVKENKFIFTGSISSRKGIEIEKSNKVAVTMWWTATEKQIRIQGDAVKITDTLADVYFAERNRESKIASIVSMQGNEIENPDILSQKYEYAKYSFLESQIQRPEHWGGFAVNPIRIELLEFRNSRFHQRTLYTYIENKWNVKYLQP